MEKALLNIGEFCEYLGIGKTKGREILRSPRCEFSVKIGSRYYAHKKRLDKALEQRGIQMP